MAFMLGSPDGGHDDAAVSPMPMALRLSDTDAAGGTDAETVEEAAVAAAGSLEEALAGVPVEEPMALAEPGPRPAVPAGAMSVGGSEPDPAATSDTLVRRIERLMAANDTLQIAPSFMAFSAMPPLPVLKIAVDPTRRAEQQPEQLEVPAEQAAIAAAALEPGEASAQPPLPEPGLAQPQPAEQADHIEPEPAAPAESVETSTAELPYAFASLVGLPGEGIDPARSVEQAELIEPPSPAAATQTGEEPGSASQFSEEGSLPAHPGPVMIPAEQTGPPETDVVDQDPAAALHPAGTGQLSAESGVVLPLRGAAPQSGQPPPMAPLANALDVAVRLAADASVAAEALENLKRLLEHKQHLQNRLPSAPAGPAPPPAALPVTAPPAAGPLPVRVAPPALQLQPEPDQEEEEEEAARVALIARRRPLPERRGLDIRGFLAGFALSWAFGVVLYLFLTAG